MPDDNNNLSASTDPTRPVLTTEEVPTTNPPSQDPGQPASPAPTPTSPPDISPIPVPETTDVPPPPTTETATTPPSNAGSSAPSFDLPPIVGAPPRKKFGGKKVISTILGLLLLVGGIGAGVTLVKQQQDIREQAAAPTSKDTCGGCADNTHRWEWKNGACKKVSDNSCKPNNTGGQTTTSQGTATSITCTSTSDACGGGGCSSTQKCVYSTSLGRPICQASSSCTTSSGGQTGCTAAQKAVCDKRGELCSAPSGICLPKNSTLSGCTAAQKAVCDKRGELCSAPSGICLPKSSTVDTGSGGGGGGSGGGGGGCSWSSSAQCQPQSPGDSCHQGRGTCVAKGDGSKGSDGKAICVCKVPDDTTCKEECPSADGILRNCTPPEADGSPEESVCSKAGRIEACGGKSYCCPAAGGKWTANMSSCQGSGTCLNVKAYTGDDTFTALTADQLKALKAGDKVRFAVAGSVSSGTTGNYDKAKFKINSTDSGEVTQQKPGSTEFWYEYTIPDGTTSFNISAQIHHSALGWSN